MTIETADTAADYSTAITDEEYIAVTNMLVAASYMVRQAGTPVAEIAERNQRRPYSSGNKGCYLRVGGGYCNCGSKTMVTLESKGKVRRSKCQRTELLLALACN